MATEPGTDINKVRPEDASATERSKQTSTLHLALLPLAIVRRCPGGIGDNSNLEEPWTGLG